LKERTIPPLGTMPPPRVVSGGPQLARPAKTKADPSARMRGNVTIEPTVARADANRR